MIRSEVGRQTGLRHTPSLEFKPDTLPDNARNIEELAVRAREADAAVAAVREGALPAGDPDPYRVRVEPDDEPDEPPRTPPDAPAAPEPLGDYPAGGRFGPGGAARTPGRTRPPGAPSRRA